ncbi:MAG TPA: GNAT family N-acetyltransferase, partial [Myxococcaceae bacterium]|nr:GNAT family N-acetyltransferase [Myxococcaceae bacterium]
RGQGRRVGGLRTPAQELCTPRARLREVRLDDAEALLDIYGHPGAVRYLGRPPQTLEQVQTRLQRMLEDIERGEAAFWVMTEPDADRALAYLGFFRWDVPHQTAELGYVVAPARWGQGLMREVLPVLVRHGFEALGLHRMEARIDPGNAASIKLVERLGFKPEGALRHRTLNADGTREDLLLFGLLRPEFDAAGVG